CWLMGSDRAYRASGMTSLSGVAKKAAWRTRRPPRPLLLQKNSRNLSVMHHRVARLRDVNDRLLPGGVHPDLIAQIAQPDHEHPAHHVDGPMPDLALPARARERNACGA